MRFYMIVKGILPDPLLIGETSFKKFWPDQGMEALVDILNKDASLVELITIRDSSNHVWEIIDFVDMLVDKYDVVFRDNNALRDSLHGNNT